jgi:hypothetical protein
MEILFQINPIFCEGEIIFLLAKIGKTIYTNVSMDGLQPDPAGGSNESKK